MAITASDKSQLDFKDHIAASHHEQLSNMDRLFRQIPYQKGFALAAYLSITDFQILKKAGVFAVEMMRTIQLMVAAFNMNNKKTGRDALQLAEMFNLIPCEQAGSRKWRRAACCTRHWKKF